MTSGTTITRRAAGQRPGGEDRRRAAGGDRGGGVVVAVHALAGQRGEQRAAVTACRESITTGPVTVARPAASAGVEPDPPVSAAISASVSGIMTGPPRRLPRARPPPRERGGGDRPVVERQHGPADVLAGLVPLARHQHHVPLPGQADGEVDRRGPVRLDDQPGPLPLRDAEHSVQHLVEDRQRVLRARVVACEDRHVGQPGGGGAHQRPLAAVPVAAAAEHHDQFPAGHRAKRAEHRLDRAGLVRVVHEASGWAARRRPRCRRPGTPGRRPRPATASLAGSAPASTSATIAPRALATLNAPGSVTDASASTPPGPITRNVEPSAPQRTSAARQSAFL